MIANNIRLQYNEDRKPEIVLTLNTTSNESIVALKEILSKGKLLDVEISQHREKRSLDANSYCWKLCQLIAEKLHTTKEEVYRVAIKRVGQFEILPLKNESVERWIKNWNSNGYGWVSEIMEDSKLPGYKKVINYYGSSTYDTREMSVLIDEIVQEAKEQGIEVLPPDQIKGLIEEWGKKE